MIRKTTPYVFVKRPKAKKIAQEERRQQGSKKGRGHRPKPQCMSSACKVHVCAVHACWLAGITLGACIEKAYPETLIPWRSVSGAHTWQPPATRAPQRS